MKEDVKMKDIMNAAPKGTMPQVGAMQHMQASPKASPQQAPPKVSPAQTAPKASPAQNMQKVSPAHSLPKVSPANSISDVLPAQTMPNIMPAEIMQNASPMQMMPDNMPVQAGPAGVMPSMMNQIPIMCCPYLMNMQCPMTYGANVMGMNMMNNAMLQGVSPAAGNMMPYMGNAAPLMGAADNNMYGMPGMGTLPVSMNNQYFPSGGMNY
ncbi:MAG: hypothetical protein GX279_12165 [Clostridiaceae bacterium]|jgi:hypothetical protein|nr:hypothetical protein [Clostridiaceae bacterium]